ncbi:acyl-CoA dehydrogenase family protein [Paraburkholderia sp. CNPSo 3076]|uniref:acyl-CoA dehydrogenase family protein n=1 Tax=Paraburkholderia sp. CNPSo 3076 TaxID=2940936 RepID=UPI002252557A|nr:acyl-CoA dehydrogenase family protein [Paraburkholderia sp. CNPSo 3076]MCX5545515.1 acyl-CoA dehydrogenase family protein [Paraburkholderia sp. CNPSo 3076]
MQKLMKQSDALHETNRPARKGYQTAPQAPSGDESPGRSALAAGRILDSIRDLAPAVLARAAEIEAERRMPSDLVEKLRLIGVFRMFAPRSRGGLELDLPWGMEVISALARLDGSVGWTAMIGSSSAIMSPRLPRQTYDLMYQDKSDVIIASVSTPGGTAERTPDGWRVSGRWPFASCCHNADWMMGLCVMAERGKPLFGPAGEAGLPLVRCVALPASAWQIEDTWRASGLRGTGSHHIALQNVLAPEANFFDFPAGASCEPGPLYQAWRHLQSVLLGAVCVGIAEGALADVADLAQGGRQQLRAPAPMRDSEMVQGELGRIEADVRAARAAMQVQAESHWRHALADTLNGQALYAQGIQTGIWIATICASAAHACFTLAGGAAVYESSPLQRRLRDLQAAAQHAMVQQRHYAEAGRLLLERVV